MGHDESPDHIPHFLVFGHPNKPEVMSNKVVLTPVSPGNQRGAIWGERDLMRTDWVADVDFRVSGGDRGGGNLNIWLANQGKSRVAANSIYTVGRFEGLALVVDQHGSSGGMLRGFLNDGSVDYSRSQNVDSLAFGHCLFNYRNLGRPSQIKVAHTGKSFKVEIDGRNCFSSDKITIPQGYNFGITGATPENPDSIEIFKLVVMSESMDGRQIQNQDPNQQNAFQYETQHQVPPVVNAQNPNQQQQHTNDETFEEIPDQDADIFITSKMQFQDLHNRLQSTYHQISAVYRSVSKHHEMDEQRHTEIRDMVTNLRQDLSRLDKLDHVSNLQRTVVELQREVQGLRDELSRRITSHENSFRGALTDHHRILSEGLVASVPGHGKLIFIFIGTQVLLAVAYVMYKRRRMNSPKKYL